MTELDRRLRRFARTVSPRTLVRGGFLAFFAYLAARLWMFYRWAEGVGPHVSRPEAVAGLIPVGAFTSLFAWIKTGIWDTVMPAGLVIILGALIVSVLFKRAFCGWICPVGTVFHGFAWGGRKVLGKNIRAPRKLDLALRGLRYVITVAILFALASVTVQEAIGFRSLPYYAVSDLKILSLMMRPTVLYFAIGGLVGVLCMLFGNVWCRYVCPLGGLYGACGAASACTIVRDPEACISCSKCSKACHAGVAVDELLSVRAPECDGCQDCVLACPVDGALQPKLGGRRGISFPWWAWPVGVVVVWLAVYGIAVGTGHWHTGLPEAAIAQFARMIIK